MLPLSVAIITHNEESNISRCIGSVRDIAAEVVVVDSGSTDRTVDIARQLGARVMHHPFEGHIQQKNYALSECSNDHVLSLDADEALSDALRRSITTCLADWKADGYTMNRLTNYCGTWVRHGGWYPDRKLRLFRRSQGTWAGINPHDEFRLANPAGRIAHVSGDLLHYSYESLSDHIRQIDYFTGITAAEYVKRGRRAGLWRLVLSPLARFVRDYVLRAGFLDGFNGFVIAVMSSYASFIKYARVRHLSRNEVDHE